MALNNYAGPQIRAQANFQEVGPAVAGNPGGANNTSKPGSAPSPAPNPQAILSDYAIRHGNQRPELARYVAPQVDALGNPVARDIGGYSYNLPNAYGNGGINPMFPGGMESVFNPSREAREYQEANYFGPPRPTFANRFAELFGSLGSGYFGDLFERRLGGGAAGPGPSKPPMAELEQKPTMRATKPLVPDQGSPALQTGTKPAPNVAPAPLSIEERRRRFRQRAMAGEFVRPRFNGQGPGRP